MVHPDYLLAAAGADKIAKYRPLRDAREAKTFRYQQGVLRGCHSLVQVKHAPPYTDEQESAVYLDPTARASFDGVSWSFGGGVKADAEASEVEQDPSSPRSSPRLRLPTTDSRSALAASLTAVSEGLRSAADRGVGVDIEPIATFKGASESFLSRNFSAAELAYCRGASDPASSFAGRWAAKEAIVKVRAAAAYRAAAASRAVLHLLTLTLSLSLPLQAISNSAPEGTGTLFPDASAPLSEAEILPGNTGAPVVKLSGNTAKIAAGLGIKLKVSISHSGEYAVATATAFA